MLPQITVTTHCGYSNNEAILLNTQNVILGQKTKNHHPRTILLNPLFIYCPDQCHELYVYSLLYVSSDMYSTICTCIQQNSYFINRAAYMI